MYAASKHTALAAASIALVLALGLTGFAGAGRGKRDKVPPTSPVNVRVTSATPYSLSLAWDAATDDVGVAGYYVYVDAIRAKLGGTTYVAGGLECGQSVYVSVVAFDAARNLSAPTSATVSTAACPDFQPPTAPSSFHQEATTQNAVVLDWTPSSDNVGVVGYGVYQNLLQVTSSSQPTVTLNGLACGSTYQYTVDAVDAAGNRSPRSSVWVQTAGCSDARPPSTPTGLATTSHTTDSVSLSWSASADNVGVAGYRVSLDGSAVSSVTQTSTTLSGLMCGTTYSVSVDAFDAAGNRSPAAVTSAATGACPPPASAPLPPPPAPSGDTTPPTKPSTLAIASATQTSAVLTWFASTDDVGVAGYDVYVNGASHGVVGQPGATISGLACGAAYIFEVDAYDAAGNHSGRSSITGVTAACAQPPPPPPSSSDATPPTTPASLAVSSATGSSVSLAWAPSTDNVAVTGYGVYLGGALVTSSSQLSATVSGLACGTAYPFAVDAYDAAGNHSARAQATASTAACADTQSPTAPTNVIVSSRTATSVSLIWSASSDNVGVTGYGLYQNGARVSSVTGTTGIFSGLACNTSYTLAVDAYDAAGNRSTKATVGVMTTTCPDTTPPSAPTGLLSSNVSQTSATLSWSASSDNVGVTGYDVYRNGTLMTTVATTSSSQSGLACGTSYSFAVVARDSAGNSSAPAQLSVVTAACSPAPLPPPPPPPPPPPSAPSSIFPSSFFTGPAGASNIVPASQGVMLGTTEAGSNASVDQQISSLESYIGRKTVIEQRFMQDTCTLDTALIKSIAANGKVPMISWSPTPENGGAILSGQADNCIKQVGQQIASLGTRIFLRFYWEGNGEWFSWSKDSSGALLSAAQQVTLWQRTVDDLRAGGAFPNASTVWCPDEGYYGNGDARTGAATYPGDSYVDWVCSDAYNHDSSGAYCGAQDSPHTGWCSFADVYHDSVKSGGNVEQDFRGRKPMMAGETGSVDGTGTQKGDWFRGARDAIKSSMPDMLALVYFDIDARQYGETENWLISTSTASQQGFHDLASDPYFAAHP